MYVNMDTTLPTRRQFGALAGGSIVALAGCLGDDEPPEEEVESPEQEEEEPEDDEYDISDQPDDAAAMFVAPEDGATVESPVPLEAEVEGVELVPPADPVVGEGHLHIVIDGDPFETTGPYETGDIIPGPDDQIEEEQGIFHWSDAQTEEEIELEPGEYTVTVQLGDGLHAAFGDTDEISITVE